MNEKLYQIALTFLRGVSVSNVKKLLSYTQTAHQLFTCSKQDLQFLTGLPSDAIHTLVNQFDDALKRAEKELEICEKFHITPLFFTDKAFPQRLLECEDGPFLLFQKGNINLNKYKFVSVVGTRMASQYGKDMCNQLVKELSESVSNCVIISGLAYGIDIAAHKAALEYNVPTIGVMASGFHRIYPTAHRNIAIKMLEQGSILSEQNYLDEPEKRFFIKRNRIIAGMADAVVVVESAAKGGAMVTANIANTYNKDVFVFPGRCGDVVSAGCNALIKHHQAALIENAADLMDIMGWKKRRKKAPSVSLQQKISQLSDIEQKIITILDQEKILHIDRLAQLTAVKVNDLLSLLILLEFQNWVVCLPGNRYQLKGV